MTQETTAPESIWWKGVRLSSWIAMVTCGIKIFSDVAYDTVVASAMEFSLSQSANFLLEGTINDPLRWMPIVVFFLAGAGIYQSNKMIKLSQAPDNVE